MRKIIFSILSVLIFTVSTKAQVNEPDFVGECILIKQDNTSVPLEKHLAQNRTVASTGLILSGIGKVRNQIQIEGCCSNTKLYKNEEVKFIIKNVDNLTDPLSIIKVFKMEAKKKYRRAELSSYSSLGSTKSNNLDYVNFTGKKFGTSSYEIKLEANLEPGEYGITISNPNALDQKQTVVSTFSVAE